MGRKIVPQPLALSDPSSAASETSSQPRSAETLQVTSPPSLGSQSSPKTPRSPFSKFSTKKPQAGPTPTSLSTADTSTSRALEDFDDDEDESEKNGAQRFPPITSALHQPVDSPSRPQRQPPRHHVDSSRSQSRSHSHPREETRPSTKSGFFSHFSKSSKSGFGNSASLPSQHNHSSSRSEMLPRGTDAAATSSKSAKHPDSDAAPADPLQKASTSQPSKSDLSLASTAADQDAAASSQSSTKKGKSKSFGRLHRTRSARDKESATPKEPPQLSLPSPTKASENERMLPLTGSTDTGLRTAPPGADRSFRDMMNSAVRNRSEDRAPPLPAREAGRKEYHNDKEQQRALAPAAHAGFFGNLRNSSTRAADMISKSIFGKGMRSGSTTEREPVVDDEHYVLRVINLPLVEQTRITRISKRLEESRDKTEFWMPAFAWRAIDFLNYKGCDVEGLYRVPGSGPQVKKWQRKFDEELDVDLFQQDDLYDINIIGSMLKAWLRELPTELLPKRIQEKVVKECSGSETVPQLLIDELSNLPPYNYYLLFAITCHLSLLLAHSDKNKMDFRNLCICFQPCMKIDAYCFKFLVCDWRECWKGCNQESKFIEEEYALLESDMPKSVSEGQSLDEQAIQERAISSSGSSKQSNSGTEHQSHQSHQSHQQSQARLKKKPVQLSESNGNINSGAPVAAPTHHDGDGDRPETAGGSKDLRPLSPIKPLSPIGF